MFGLPEQRCMNEPIGRKSYFRVLIAHLFMFCVFLCVFLKVRNDGNITTWKDAYFNKPRPYFSNKGFENPPCTERMKRQTTSVGTYVLGAEDTCMSEGNEERFCNGPLKPKKDYVYVHIVQLIVHRVSKYSYCSERCWTFTFTFLL